jgi:GNAT superfamily N-acetyltransferase
MNLGDELDVLAGRPAAHKSDAVPPGTWHRARMGSGVTIEVGRCDPDAVAALLHGLQEWFGIDEATAAYVDAARTMPTVLAHDDGAVVGALLWTRHFSAAAEVHLMAVDAARHRQGIGTALLERSEDELRADGVRYLQVKTLGPSRPDDEYERTRRFYEARGFVALEEMFGVWPEDNPMLILVKAL